MNIPIFSFLFLMSFSSISQAKRINLIRKTTETNETELGEIQLFIPLYIPSFKKTLNALYDTSSNMLVVNQNEIDNEQLSESIGDQPTNILTTYGSYNGKVYSEEMSILYMSEKQLNVFVLANSINFNGKLESNHSIWGLGRHFGNFNLNKYSNQTLIEKLFENEVIPYRNFGHKFLNQRTPYFFYGEYINENDYYSCQSQNEKIMGDSWNCRMQIIKFSTESVITTTLRDGIFATGINRIILPKEDFDKLIDEFIKLTSCVVTEKQPLKVQCPSADAYSSFPNITFTFDSFNLHLNRSEYMIPITSQSNEYISPIECSETNDYWLLGLPLLKRYDMLFDYESNTVVFLNLIKEDFISINNPKFKVALIAFSSSLVVFIMYIYYIIYLRKMSKKKKNALLPKPEEKETNDVVLKTIKRTKNSNAI